MRTVWTVVRIADGIPNGCWYTNDPTGKMYENPNTPGCGPYIVLGPFKANIPAEGDFFDMFRNYIWVYPVGSPNSPQHAGITKPTLVGLL